MFTRVLVANRGEIAVRVIRTLRRLGIHPVLAASIPDRHSLAARHAGETVVLDGYSSAETYLDQDAVIAAAKHTGCEAIHPGYGFLAENPDFAERCASEGVAFVGPPAEALRRLGSKTAARAIAVDCGVPVVPGYDGPDDDDALAREAERVGFPLVTKARAGGGGRGMRVVRAPGEIAEAVAAARREAAAAFGDGSLFLERYIERARHVEVQVVADTHGNLLHLGERDCSIQRRHQKVIEEAPSPIVDEALRAELTAAALKIAEAVGYVNAGTFEFLVGEPGQDGARPYWFIEANPRLQVEHPVTEEITGLDIVELQLRIAAGEPLPLRQGDVTFSGHAIELRLNAEDPRSDFAPSAGRLRRLDLGSGPAPGTRVRFDAGFEPGDEIPAYYDSLIGKLIAHAPDRSQAIAALVSNMPLTTPLVTNAALLRAVISHQDFAGDAIHIEWLESRLKEVLDRAQPPLVALAAAAACTWAQRDASWIGAGQLAMWLHDGAETHCVHLCSGRAGAMHLAIGEVEMNATAPAFSPAVWVDGQRCHVTAEGEDTLSVDAGGETWRFTIVPPPPLPRHARPTVPGSTAVTAPLSGTVAAVYVAEGDEVEAGQLLLTLEAMKMEHRLVAPASGVIASVTVAPGDQVAQGHPLVELGE